MVYFCEEIGNLCPTNWFKQGSIMFFFQNKLNLGTKLNVNFARISKIPPLHKIEFSLFSRNLWIQDKNAQKEFSWLGSKKLLRTNQRFHPKFGNTPRVKRKVSEFRTPPKSAKMFQNFGSPQRVQRCFRISDTPKQCKDVSSEIWRILHILGKPNSIIIALLFMQNNSNFKNKLNHAYLGRCLFHIDSASLVLPEI